MLLKTRSRSIGGLLLIKRCQARLVVKDRAILMTGSADMMGPGEEDVEAYEEEAYVVDPEVVDMGEETNMVGLCHLQMPLDQCLLRDTIGLGQHHRE